MSVASAAVPVGRHHGLELSWVAWAALYVLFAIGGLLVLAIDVAYLVYLLTVAPAKEPVFSFTQDNLAWDWLQELGMVTVGAAHWGAIVGLARGREWGRLLGTYASGWWMVTIVLIPVSLGIAWVLWHRHLPERARHAVAHVTGAFRIPHAESPAATQADGLAHSHRRWVVGLLALSLPLFLYAFLAGAYGSFASLPAAIIAAVHGVVLSAFLAAAVIGVGRGFGWGRPLAAFASGFLAMSGYAFLCVAVALYLLCRDGAFSGEAAGGALAPAQAPGTPAS